MMMIQDCKSNHRPFDIINSEHELPDQNFAFNGSLSEGEKNGNSKKSSEISPCFFPKVAHIFARLIHIIISLKCQFNEWKRKR